MVEKKRVHAATIYNVASRAGVSHQTVSRYLSGFEGIRPATRERVAAALEELDYRPNISARTLATSTSHRIAALTSDLISAGPSQTLQGVANAARAAGYLLDIIAIDLKIPESLTDAVNLVRRQDLAGVVVIAVSDAARHAISDINFGAPIYLDSGPADLVAEPGTSFNALGTRMIVEHLVELGHRDIVNLAGPAEWVAARNRANAFSAVVAEHGLVEYPGLAGDWSARSGYEAVRTADLDPAVTAIVAANDQMALGAIHALAQRGISVPDRMSVTGFDDIQEAAYFLPALTTVRIDFERQGTFVFDALLASIRGADAPESAAFMRPELIVRESTAAPR